jgi:glycosyltransferase involved in cell wall biosynthesis
LVLASTYPRWANDPEPAFVHELARRLVDGFEVHVLAPHAKGAQLTEWMDGVCVHRYRYGPQRWESLVHGGGVLANLRRSPWKWLLVPGFILAQYAATLRLLSRLQPQIVHAHWLLPQGVVAAIASTKTPWVVTSHGADLFALNGALFISLRRWVVSRAAAITVVSQAMRQRLARETPDNRISVLSMGVDTSTRFTPGTNRSINELLFVGRLVEKKGLKHLIRALPMVVEKSPQTVLSIVGDGPERERLEQQVLDLGMEKHVDFLGALPQVALPEFYRRATLFIAPFIEATGGDQEGLGLVVAEAMACGCPVIVGDVEAVHDLVGSGIGQIVSPQDHAAFADTIVALLNDDVARGALSIAGRYHVEKYFSWNVVSRQYSELLAGLMAARP